MQNIEGLTHKYPPQIVDELMISLSRRLKNLIRPLDDIARIAPYSFCVITHQPHIKSCEGGSFQRLLKAINTKAFQTTMGFEQLNVHMSIVAACADNGMPAIAQIFALSEQLMKKTGSAHRIEHYHYYSES